MVFFVGLLPKKYNLEGKCSKRIKSVNFEISLYTIPKFFFYGRLELKIFFFKEKGGLVLLFIWKEGRSFFKIKILFRYGIFVVLFLKQTVFSMISLRFFYLNLVFWLKIVNKLLFLHLMKMLLFRSKIDKMSSLKHFFFTWKLRHPKMRFAVFLMKMV